MDVVYFNQRLGAALVDIFNFSVFNGKKLKKARNLHQNFAKNTFFGFAPKPWSKVLFPKKQLFS